MRTQGDTEEGKGQSKGCHPDAGVLCELTSSHGNHYPEHPQSSDVEHPAATSCLCAHFSPESRMDVPDGLLPASGGHTKVAGRSKSCPGR